MFGGIFGLISIVGLLFLAPSLGLTQGGAMGTGAGVGGFMGLGISITAFVVIAVVAYFWMKVNKKAGGLFVIGSLVFLLLMSSVGNILAIQKDIARRSETYGESAIVDVYEDFTFYDLKLAPSDAIFYISEGKYVCKKEYKKAVEFNGTENKYNLIVNNTPADITTSSAAMVKAIYKLKFLDFYGDVACEIPLEFLYVFSVSKTSLEIKADIDADSYDYLRQYVEVTGLHLRLIDEQYEKIGGIK